MEPAKHNAQPPDLLACQRIHIHNLTEMNEALSRILQEMAAAGYSARDQFGVRLSLEEAIVNAIKHGNREDPAKFVELTYSVTGHQVLTEIEDQGPGFNPYLIPDPLSPENLERPGGRGVFLMRHYMTTVHYN